MSSSSPAQRQVRLRDQAAHGVYALVPAGTGVELQERLVRPERPVDLNPAWMGEFGTSGVDLLGFGQVHPEPIREALSAANCQVTVDEDVVFPERTYRVPLERLLSVGPIGRTGEFETADLPELLRMAGDPRLHTAPESGPLRWAPIHAARALASMKADSALRPLVNLLKQVPHGTDSVVATEFPRILSQFGPAALGPVGAFLVQSRGSTTAQVAAARVISEVGQQHPDARLDCVSRLRLVLAGAQQRSARLNAQIISNLVDLQGVEAAPEIERAFATNSVDLNIAGDWPSVQIALGLVKPAPVNKGKFKLPLRPKAPRSSGSPTLAKDRVPPSGTRIPDYKPGPMPSFNFEDEGEGSTPVSVKLPLATASLPAPPPFLSPPQPAEPLILQSVAENRAPVTEVPTAVLPSVVPRPAQVELTPSDLRTCPPGTTALLEVPPAVTGPAAPVVPSPAPDPVDAVPLPPAGESLHTAAPADNAVACAVPEAVVIPPPPTPRPDAIEVPNTPAAKVRISVPRRSTGAPTPDETPPAPSQVVTPLMDPVPAAELVSTVIEPPTTPRVDVSPTPSPEPAGGTPIHRLTEVLGILAEPRQIQLNTPVHTAPKARKEPASKKTGNDGSTPAARQARPEVAPAREVEKPGLGRRLLRVLRGEPETGSASPAGTPSGSADAGTAHVVGRNDPCPCGSGLKFKKCCG